jgi:phosphomevalonate kinase
MIARAPGKVVISGAYAVLEGAPAIVAAVDRYVVADSSRVTDASTPEVRAAIGPGPAPAFDAQALREGDEKLGLGSSAAIVVASLAALELARSGPLADDELARRVLAPALLAHRKAQGGGSGIDVAASAHGGILVARTSGDTVHTHRVRFPDALCIRVWASGQPASTAELLARVRDLRLRSPATHRERLLALCTAAESASVALENGDAAALVAALAAQCLALSELGNAVSAPIVTPFVRDLMQAAARENAAVLPSGAGGGDIALYAGTRPPSDALSARAREQGHRDLALGLGARGVHQSVLSVERR